VCKKNSTHKKTIEKKENNEEVPASPEYTRKDEQRHLETQAHITPILGEKNNRMQDIHGYSVVGVERNRGVSPGHVQPSATRVTNGCWALPPSGVGGEKKK
jgi:hypothetical protein